MKNKYIHTYVHISHNHTQRNVKSKIKQITLGINRNWCRKPRQEKVGRCSNVVPVAACKKMLACCPWDMRGEQVQRQRCRQVTRLLRWQKCQEQLNTVIGDRQQEPWRARSTRCLSWAGHEEYCPLWERWLRRRSKQRHDSGHGAESGGEEQALMDPQLDCLWGEQTVCLEAFILPPCFIW